MKHGDLLQFQEESAIAWSEKGVIQVAAPHLTSYN